MNAIFQNLILTGAIVISLVVHGILMLLHFSAPRPQVASTNDQVLEVILVNAKHDTKPLDADLEAQVNLDGGGNAESGRAKSPFPDMKRIEDGDSLVAATKRAEELEDQQKQLLSQMKQNPKFRINQDPAKLSAEDSKVPVSGRDAFDSSKAIARSAAEINETIEEQNKRPRRTFLNLRAKEAGYAAYKLAMRKHIEDIGTLNFPQNNGNKLYGDLVITMSIFQDGSIYEKDGVKIERSSGNHSLDEAAVRIVRRAAPYGKFPSSMRSHDKDDVWIVVWNFSFTHDQTLEANLKGVKK